jgi:chromosome segregation ATPase
METNTKKQELESHIAELERSITELKVQLRQLEESDQHQAIDNLEAYLVTMENRWDTLKDFWPIVHNELRDIFVKMKGEKTP